MTPARPDMTLIGHLHRPLRGHAGRTLLATAVACAAAIALVAIGVGTGNRASSSPDIAITPVVPVSPSVGSTSAPSDRESIVDAGFASPRIREFLAQILPGRFGLSSCDDAPLPLSQPSEMALYNGRPVRTVGILRMKVTAYSPDFRSCGASADGITASGYSVLTNGGCMVAADPAILPLGSLVSVPGYDGGAVVPVLDTGGAIKGHRLDVLYPTHELAMRWGVQEVDVQVWEYADGLPNGFRRMRRPSN